MEDFQNTTPQNAPVLPPEYRPLGAWAYFGYSILFAIPVVGFICLLIFSFNNNNINRRNYARSFWCALLVTVVLGVIAAIAGVNFAALLPNMR